MHSKRLRRRLHAARAPQRRDDGDTDFGENAGAVVVGGLTLTGPITLTLISTLPSSTQSSTSLSSTSNTVQSTMTLTSSSSSSSTTSNAASQTPSTSTPPASTPVPSVILPAVTSAGGSGKMLQSGALSTTKIPAGGIVGVVIGCLIVLAAGLFFLIRSRSRRGRMKLRNTWTRNAPIGIRSSSYEPKPFVGDSVSSDMSPEMRFAPPPPPQMHPNPPAISIPVSSNMPAPPPSYNNADVYDGIVPLSAVSPRTSRVLSPTSVYSPTSAAISPSSATVICTFIVTLPDELSIKVGEMVRILAEYDDGWVLCMNADGEQGMVPLECLSRGRPTASSDGGLMPPMLDRDARGARRVSSLGPSAPALKVYTT